jgi:hypothetical protein
LSSNPFDNPRQFVLAREYALLALAEPNEILLETELDLVGHVISDMRAIGDPEWPTRRREDAEIRLHAWKRLSDAIDPDWDPNAVAWSPNAIGVKMGFDGYVAPESIADVKLRAEYEAAIEKNRQITERWSRQMRLHRRVKWYLPREEKYIVRAYSEPPYDIKELAALLNQYMRDERARVRMLNAVTEAMNVSGLEASGTISGD